MHSCLLLWASVGRSFIVASDSRSRMSFSMEHGAPVNQRNGTKPFCASAGLDFKLHVIFAPLLCELESWNEYEGEKEGADWVLAFSLLCFLLA